ncbi:unnamed protein product [Meganyctiphanes norvegica]|uniref:SH2 domain-containing protein n=1 Tax=Meganyctiphanes norvegica TaxID=48144 RepID=A0AAV2Q143_MEGNR
MLQQILTDMYIEPELLTELDEEQKQVLFCKMREEQIRRWKIREEHDEVIKKPPNKKSSSKKVTFLVGCDGEPVVVVLGAGAGSNNVEDVDHLLQEQARHQADQESDMIKKAAEEELDKLVRLSRSTVAAMEQDASKTNTSKVRDATREAVVQSLQEATMEMERNIRALEEVAPSIDLPLQEATNTALPAVNGSSHANGEMDRLNGSSTNGFLQIVNGSTNGTMGVFNGSMSNMTESSTDTNRSIHNFSSNGSESSASTASLSSLSTLSDPSTPSPSTSPPSPPAFTISSYGGRYSPPHKLHTSNIWGNEKVSSTNTISNNNKPPITTPKPIITTKTTTTVSSSTTLKTLNGTIVANKNANNITTTNGHNITHSVTNNQSTISKTFNSNDNNIQTIPSSIHSNGRNSFSSNGSTSSNSITPPSSLSSTVSMASLPPSPPPSAPSSPTIVLEDCLKEEMEAMEKLEAIRAAAEASEIQRMGVAAQIRRWEQFSEGSLEALKTATLERAKKRRQREILENLRHQVEVARRGQGHHDDAKHIPEKDDQAWQEQERKAKEAERRIREIARRAREEHRRAAHTLPNGASVPHAHAINRNLNGLTHNSLFKNGINTIGTISTNGGDINGNIKSLIDDVSNNNSDSSSNKDGRTCVRQRIRPPKPPSRGAIVTWFREEEIARGSGLDPSKSNVAPWFHGIISRVEAEEVLSGSAVGSFLVRVSERIWGYAISYRGADRCRHYLIDVTNGKYTFFGSHNASHDALSELVEHHRTEPITSTGGELLTQPRGQLNPCRPDYLELFTGTQYLTL